MAVIPSGTSEPWFWAARESAANDALARLFYSLIAKREDRNDARQQREDLFERQKAFQDYMRTRQEDFTREQNDKWRTPPGAGVPSGPGLLGGTGAGTRAPAPAAPAPAAPSVGPGTRSFTPGSGFGPPTGKFSQNTAQPGLDSFAQAGDEDTDGDGAVLPTNGRPTGYTTELSADTVKTPKNKPVTPKYTPGQVAVPPRKSRYVDQTYGDIPDDISAAWAASEKKYGLPQGILQTVMGLTHQGGRTLGANGWFGLNPDIRRTFSIPDSAINDPAAMGNYAAQNLQRNIASYNAMAKGLNIPQLTGKSAAEIPMLALLMRTGPKDGPRLIAQLHTNADAPLHATLAPGDTDPARRVVTEFGMPSDATVGDLYKKMREQVKPYAERTIMMQDTQQPQVNDDKTAPIPPKGVGAGDPYEYLISRGATKQGAYTLRRPFAEKMAAILQKGEAATGQKASINNGYRTPEEQAQIRANSRNVNVYWNGVKYSPQPGPRGFPAAAPGKSNHQDGTAMDLNSGAVRDWVRGNLRGSGLRTISNDAPHIELDIPKRIGMARPRDTHPDGTPPTATASAPQQPAATAAATPDPSAAAAASTPTPAERGAVGFFGTDKDKPSGAITTAGTFADPYNPQVAAATPLPQPRPDAASAEAATPPQPVVTQQTTEPQPQPPPPTPAPVADPNRQVALDERGSAPTTLSADNRQAALDERGLPPASVGPQGLVSPPPPNPQQDAIMNRAATDLQDRTEAPTGQTVQQAFSPISVGKLLDRLTGDDQILPSNQGVDEAGMAEFGQSLPNKTGTGVQDIMDWIKQKAEAYSKAREDDRTTQKWQEDEPLRARMRGPIPAPNDPYDPGFLTPEKRKELEDAIMKRRVDNPPPDSQGGGYSPGMLDPAKIEEERIRQNEATADMRTRNPVQNVDPAASLSQAIFGGGTAASADTMATEPSLPPPPDDTVSQGTPNNVDAGDTGPGMESMPDDRGEVAVAQMTGGGMVPAGTPASADVASSEPIPLPNVSGMMQNLGKPAAPEMNVPIEGDRSGLSALLQAFGGGKGIDLAPKEGDDEKFALMNTLMNYFKGAPKDTRSVKTIPIRPPVPTTLPSGEPLIVTQPGFKPIPKPTTGAAPTAIPGGLLQGGTMPPPPGGGKYKIDPATGKVVVQ